MFGISKKPSLKRHAVPVCSMPSIAANFIGCLSATNRVAQSPTITWTGAVTAAKVNGMAKPRRW